MGSPLVLHLPLLQLCRALQMRHQACEQAAAVGAAHDVFDVVFRMRHHAEHIAAFADDASDRVRGAIDVGTFVERAIGRIARAAAVFVSMSASLN